jgi:hypothetical protein
VDCYTHLERCRVCGSEDLTQVIRIEPQHLSPTFVEDNATADAADVLVPMTLRLCNAETGGCGLLQLHETVDPDMLYRQYFYRSSTNAMMREHLKDVVRDVSSRVALEDGSMVVDIGANDGTLLRQYPETLQRVGLEPAQNIDWSELPDSITIVNDYFSAAALKGKFPDASAKIFTCCAMFYDLSDPNAFVAQIKESLAPDGVWCAQLSYLPLMLRNLNFYDICHEHLTYYSLAVLENLMDRNGLKVFDASTNGVNGGSIRVFVTHEDSDRPLDAAEEARLEALRAEETALQLTNPETYTKFWTEIESLGQKVRDYLEARSAEGRKVLGLGASTKGNVLLQLFGITKELMPAISERNPDKVGLRTLGTDIELISEEAARAQDPAVMLVLPWYFKDEIVEREREWLSSGGKLLFPMPYAHVVHGDREEKL